MWVIPCAPPCSQPSLLPAGTPLLQPRFRAPHLCLWPFPSLLIIWLCRATFSSSPGSRCPRRSRHQSRPAGCHENGLTRCRRCVAVAAPEAEPFPAPGSLCSCCRDEPSLGAGREVGGNPGVDHDVIQQVTLTPLPPTPAWTVTPVWHFPVPGVLAPALGHGSLHPWFLPLFGVVGAEVSPPLGLCLCWGHAGPGASAQCGGVTPRSLGPVCLWLWAGAWWV